ncbi:MAG: molybdopterin-dependent oxidoreductase [Gemmatimonas sp.]|nr:molybdopterin-dependent oxidoreductase [Gemmatimonas sp.]
MGRHGSLCESHGTRVPDLTLSMLPGPYDFGAYEGIGHCVMTNRTPTATYRAPGGFESCFVRERLVEPLHREDRGGSDRGPPQELDSLRTDAVLASARGERVVYLEGDYPKLLDRVAGELDRESIATRRAEGERVGVGIAMFLEESGLGPWESGAVT